MADQLPSNDYLHGIRVVRVRRLWHQHGPARLADALSCEATDDLPESVLVERFADDLERLIAAEQGRRSNRRDLLHASPEQAADECGHGAIFIGGPRDCKRAWRETRYLGDRKRASSSSTTFSGIWKKSNTA
jgi:hypothetical protein